MAQALCRAYLKYSYGHKRIMLPVTDLGFPDFSYMEDYISEMLIFKRKQYLDFLYS